MLKPSIIIPTFNRATLLRAAIESILRQAYPVHEIIIADDGSSDDTVDVCRELQANVAPSRIIVTRTEKNHGAQVARNRGMSLATGDVVMFLDSDDALAEDGLGPVLLPLEKNDQLDFTYGLAVKTGPDLRPLPGERPVGGPYVSTPVEVAGYHWAVMGAIYRREFLAKVGPWNEALTGSQDWEYQGRVKLLDGRGLFVDHIVALIRVHQGNRVGAKKFRPDYVRSVELACISLRQHAEKAGKLDHKLRRRLALKLYLHALEFSHNGYADDRSRLLGEAAQIAGGLDNMFFRFAKLMPRFVDASIWSILKQND